tara:strand:+ start:458 stop:1096 length:639 start_codon:yes stop_codon:yes gene_type:complete
MSVKPIFFALDGKSLNEFEFELKKLKNKIYGVKVGLEMFVSEGPNVINRLKDQGWKVFLDLKLHDIPNTVKEATKSAGEIGADYLTIHISSSKEALYEASSNKKEDLKLLGVSSALTSKAIDEETSKKVQLEFELAKESNLDGIICPPSEIIKSINIFDLIVSPGIRLKDDLSNDQKNITTPEKAIADGASYIVMGRSIRNNLDYVINELNL